MGNDFLDCRFYSLLKAAFHFFALMAVTFSSICFTLIYGLFTPIGGKLQKPVKHAVITSYLSTWLTKNTGGSVLLSFEK